MSTTVVPSINLKPKPDSVLQTVLDDVMHLLPSDGVACFLLGADQHVARVAFTGLVASHAQQIAVQTQAIAPYIQKALAASEPIALPRYDSPTAVSIWAEAEQHGYKTVLCVPLFKASHEHEGLGMFMVYSQQSLRDFDVQRQNFLLGLARQLSLMLDRAHLLEAERQGRIRLEALQEVQIQLGRSLDLDEVLDALLIQVGRVVPYDTANLTLFEKEKIKVIRTAGYENAPYDDILGKQINMSQMPTLLQIWREKKSLIIPDTRIYANWWQAPGQAYILSWVGVPIIVSGEVVAVMGLDKTETNFYTPEMAHLLDSFAAQGAIALRNAQLFEAQNQQAQQLAHMHQLTRTLSTIDSARVLSQTVVEFLHELFGFEYVAVFLYQPTRQQYCLAALSGLAWQPDEGEYVLSAADSLVSTAVETKRIIQAAAPALDDHFAGIGNLGLQTQIAIPLWRQTYPLGVLTVASTAVDGFQQHDIDILQNVVDQATDALDKIRLLNSTQQHIQELEALFNLSTSLREAYTLEEIAQTVVHHAYTAVGAAGTNLWLKQGNKTLVMKACQPRHPMAVGTEIPNTSGLVGQAFQKSQPIVSDSLPNLAQAYPAIIERRLMSNAEASIVVPIITAEATIGVLNVWLNEFHRELALETRLLTAVGELAANAFERADLLASLERRVAIRTKELEEANESLQELDKLKSRFVSEVTHELRTPTANLRLYLDLFNRTNNPQKQARYVDVLNKQTTRLEHLVENILYLSRLDMSKESLNFTALKLQDVVEQVLVAMAEQAEEASLSLTFESKPIPLILGEENQLAQMITNLVDNAISYNEPNGVVQIRLFSASADTVRLEIQDNGRGIDYEDWDHIFSRFYRGQNATQSNIPGRGLGLAIVKEIVDLHHGRVEMESAPGAGTTFCVEFPAINLKQILPR